MTTLTLKLTSLYMAYAPGFGVFAATGYANGLLAVARIVMPSVRTLHALLIPVDESDTPDRKSVV